MSKSKTITQAQIDAWKKQHGDIFCVQLKTEPKKTFYLRTPRRQELSLLLGMMSDTSKVLDATETLTKTCFLGGDAPDYDSSKELLTLSSQVSVLLQTAEASVKKC